MNSKQYKSSRLDADDYSYYNDYEVMKVRRRGRQNAGWRSRRRGHGWLTGTAHTINECSRYLLLSVVTVLLLNSTVDTIRL